MEWSSFLILHTQWCCSRTTLAKDTIKDRVAQKSSECWYLPRKCTHTQVKPLHIYVPSQSSPTQVGNAKSPTWSAKKIKKPQNSGSVTSIFAKVHWFMQATEPEPTEACWLIQMKCKVRCIELMILTLLEREVSCFEGVSVKGFKHDQMLVVKDGNDGQL